MGFIEWLNGLADALRDAGQQEAAKVIREAIGPEGKSGIAQVLAEYNSGNTLDLGPIQLPVEVQVEGSDQPIKATVKLDTHPIVTGILAGGLLTAWLANGS